MAGPEARSFALTQIRATRPECIPHTWHGHHGDVENKVRFPHLHSHDGGEQTISTPKPKRESLAMNS